MIFLKWDVDKVDGCGDRGNLVHDQQLEIGRVDNL